MELVLLVEADLNEAMLTPAIFSMLSSALLLTPTRAARLSQDFTKYVVLTPTQYL